MLTVGSRSSYEWLVTDDNFDLLKLCPEIILGKYVAITSFDSGEFIPTEEETASGWQSHGRIAYSPVIKNAGELPNDGWDEWYIFDAPTNLGISHLEDNIFEVPHEHGHLSVLVNYGFALHPPERLGPGLAELFWKQLERIRPESYVADNDYLTFVSMNKALFASVHHAVEALSAP